MRILDKTAEHVLLERHPSGCGAPTEGGMHVVGDVFDPAVTPFLMRVAMRRALASPSVLRAFAGGSIFGATFGTSPPWVVALHGWQRSSGDFATVLGGLDAIALDLPGFGASPPPPEPWGSAEYADAVATVLGEVGGGPFVVLGHSFGGRVAVQLAAQHPRHVRALVLTGAPLVRPLGGTTNRPAAGYRLGRWLHRRGLVSDTRMERLRRRYGSTDYAAATGVMRAVHVRLVNETYDDALAAVACPVTLVWGDDDTEAPLAGAEAAAARLATAELQVVPGAGHLTPLTIPDALREALVRHRP